MTTIVVFGASGRIGGLVAERLARAGRPLRVRCVSRSARFPAGVEGVAADADRPETLVPALRGATGVFIATPIGERLEAQQRAIVAAAAAAGVERIVKLSGSDWTMADSESGRAHRAVETMLDTLPIATVSIRPNVFTQTFLARAKADAAEGRAVRLPIGAAAFACIDVRDIADVAVHALEAPAAGHVVHSITGPAAVTGDWVAAQLGAQYEPIALEAALEAAHGASGFLLRHLEAMYRLIAAGAAARVGDTVARLLERPARSADEFLRG